MNKEAHIQVFSCNTGELIQDGINNYSKTIAKNFEEYKKYVFKENEHIYVIDTLEETEDNITFDIVNIDVMGKKIALRLSYTKC